MIRKPPTRLWSLYPDFCHGVPPCRSTLSNIDKFWNHPGYRREEGMGDSGNRMCATKYGDRIFGETHQPINPLAALSGEPSAAKAGVCIYAMTSEAIFTTDHVGPLMRTWRSKVVEGNQPTFDLWIYTAPQLKIKQGSRTTHLLSGCLPRRAPAHSSREASP